MYFHPSSQKRALERCGPHTSERPWPAAGAAPHSPTPGGADKASVWKVLLPVDAAQSVERAIDLIASRAQEKVLWLYLVNVQQPVRVGEISYLQTAETVLQERWAAGERIVLPARALLEARGIRHIARVLIGQPAMAIARYAEQHSCDCIVMVPRRGSRLMKAIRGSVTRRVTALSDVPVVLLAPKTGDRRSPRGARRRKALAAVPHRSPDSIAHLSSVPARVAGDRHVS